MSNTEILQRIRELKRNYSLTLGVSIGLLVLGFLCFIGGMMGGGPVTALGFLLFIIGMVALVLSSGPKKKMKAFVGEYVTEPVIREFIDLQHFDPNAYIDRDIINDLEIFGGHNRTDGSDLIVGTYGGNHLEMCDLLLQEVTSNGKTTTTVTVFEGQLVAYSLKKRLQGYVEVKKKGFGKPGGFLKRLSNFGSRISKGRDYENVEMENSAFNEMFDVRAESPQDAFLVLTPQFMERLMEIYNEVSTNFCFTEDTLYMAVYSKDDRFEVKGDFNDEADLENFRERIRSDLRKTTDLLDVIRRNEYLF